MNADPADDRSADPPDRHATDRAVADATTQPQAPAPDQPIDADWTPATDAGTPEDAVAPADDGALESLGRAISEPVVDAAAADEKAQTGR